MWVALALMALLAALGIGKRRGATGAEPARAAGTAVLLATALVVAMAQVIVVAVLPVLRERLDTTPAGAAWLLTAFMLASAVAVPIGSRLGDDLGHRRVLVAVLAIFAAATALAGAADLAGSYAGVLIGRALQGVGGAAFPLTLAIARAADPTGGNGRTVAALSAMFGVGGAAGMVVAGPVADLLGTAGLFWVTLLLTVACLAGTVLLPAGSARPGTGRLDVPGALLLSGALVGLLLVISQASTWPPTTTAGVAAATLALGVAFVLVERRAAAPLVDLATFARGPLAATNSATLVVSTAMFAAVTLLPVLAQTSPAAGYGFGMSATGTGLLMVPVAVLMLVAGPLAPAVAARLGARVPFQLGAALAAVAFVLLALAHDQLWQLYLAGAILGAGYGLAFASLGALVLTAAEPGRAATAAGINTIVRTAGGATGAQLAAAVLTGVPGEGGFVLAALLFAGLAAVAAAVAATISAGRSRPSASPVARRVSPRR